MPEKSLARGIESPTNEIEVREMAELDGITLGKNFVSSRGAKKDVDGGRCSRGVGVAGDIVEQERKPPLAFGEDVGAVVPMA